MKKRQNISIKLIPNTDITVKEFKEMLFEKFKAYPMMSCNYKHQYLIIHQTFYDNIDITTNKLLKFCNNIGVKCYKSGYPSSDFIFYSFLKPNCVVIDLIPRQAFRNDVCIFTV